MEAGAVVRGKTAAAVMRHPVRVQILVIANDRDISATRFVQEVMGLSLAEQPADYKRALSHVSFHFRELEKAGCIEVVEMVPRRGAFERVYRGTMRAHFTDDEWSEVPDDEKGRITTVAWQGLMARTEAARMAGTLDARDDRWLGWTVAKLDERGWTEMMAAMSRSFDALEQIRVDAEARLEETDGEAIPATFAVLGYESPPER